MFWITNRRVVIHGAHRVRECPFSSLIAVECDEAHMLMRYEVGNRTEIARAHHRNDVPQLITRL